MPDSPADLDAAYARLNLATTASLEELDRAYFRLKAEKINSHQRQDIPALKSCYTLIKAHLEAMRVSQYDESVAMPVHASQDMTSHDIRGWIAKGLRSAFEVQGLTVQVKTSGRELHIQLIDRGWEKQSQGRCGASITQRSQIIAQIHTWLKNNASSVVHSPLQRVKISAHRHQSRALWTQTIPMPGARSSFADHDLTSFQSRGGQLFAFPGLLIMALCMNVLPPVKFLLRGITIWFHEFGHATVAWLAGRKALPLPFGWTNVEPNKSLFVYLGILILLGLLGRAGYREQRRWPIALAIALGIIQFYMSWIMTTETFGMLMSFGGIGGEFYLCTLLIVSFFFPLPEYFRWDIYRYPAVLGAAFTFLGSFSLWQQIDRGKQSIPWGSLWGGADHQGGDMNQLSLVYNWSDQTIIDTYNTLGGLCLSVMIGVYLYFVWKNQRSHLSLFWHQIKASYWQ